jgi:CheY-like chemotaxis protein
MGPESIVDSEPRPLHSVDHREPRQVSTPILVVEDDPQLRDTFQLLLEGEGYPVADLVTAPWLLLTLADADLARSGPDSRIITSAGRGDQRGCRACSSGGVSALEEARSPFQAGHHPRLIPDQRE